MFSESVKQLWGFHPMQEAYFYTLSESLRENGSLLVPARVIFSSHDHYKILILGKEEEKFAKVRGHYYHENLELPTVGDWVVVEVSSGDHQFIPIENTLPRISALRRLDPQRTHQTLVANVNHIGLVTSFNQDWNIRRLERGLAMVSESGASALIIVNKSDLVTPLEVSKSLEELSQTFRGVNVMSVSAQNQQGIDQIRGHFRKGDCVAFIGMSGVGKSTLTNAILGVDRLATSEIRESDSRGRHTTTHREMVLSEQGFWIIDNPGIREFSYAGEEGALENSFEDISALMKLCRFGNCSHQGDLGCKVEEALDKGELSNSRWENFLKMKRELAFQENKNNKQYNSLKKKEYAKRNVDLRAMLKERGRK